MTTQNSTASDSNSLLLRQTATWAIKTLPGREVAESDAHLQSMKWGMTYCVNPEEESPTEDEFRAEISKAEPITTKETLFRFRSWDETGPPDSMGPPPDADASPGRYNKKRQAALYLCSSEHGCQLERKSIKNDQRPYYVQTFEIDFRELKVADTTALPHSSLANHAFLFAERCNFTEAYPDSYLFSQKLASIVAEKGFEGMKVFGVRSDGTQYANFVIFRPNEIEWTAWLRGAPGGPFQP